MGSLIQLLFPFLTQAIVDIGIQDKSISFIWLILLGQFVLLLSRTIITFIRNKILLHISARINISLISDFFIKLMRLPMKFFDTKLLGDLLQRIEDHQRIEDFLTNQLLNFIFSLFTFIIFSLVLYIYNVPIFFVFLLGSILYGVWIFIFLEKKKIFRLYVLQPTRCQSKFGSTISKWNAGIKLQGCERKKKMEMGRLKSGFV